MISPEKFSKSIGNKKFKIGVSIKELGMCAFVPPIGDLLDVEPFYSFCFFLMCICVLSLKNKILEPAYIENKINHKPQMEWRKVKIND